MKRFTDSQGQEWDLSITAGTLKRVADLLEIDLGQPYGGSPPLMSRLNLDVILLVNLLCAVCRPQAEQRTLTDEQFAERLGGDALRAARTALIDEWTLFFQSLGRADLVEAITKGEARVQTEIASDAARIASDDFDRRLDAELNQLRALHEAKTPDLTPPGGSAVSSPPSPAADPSLTP